MKEVVAQHDQRIQHRRGEHGGFVYEFGKRIEGNQRIVIAEIKQQECWLITGWSEDDEN